MICEKPRICLLTRLLQVKKLLTEYFHKIIHFQVILPVVVVLKSCQMDDFSKAKAWLFLHESQRTPRIPNPRSVHVCVLRLVGVHN